MNRINNQALTGERALFKSEDLFFFHFLILPFILNKIYVDITLSII